MSENQQKACQSSELTCQTEKQMERDWCWKTNVAHIQESFEGVMKLNKGG